VPDPTTNLIKTFKKEKYGVEISVG